MHATKDYSTGRRSLLGSSAAEAGGVCRRQGRTTMMIVTRGLAGSCRCAVASPPPQRRRRNGTCRRLIRTAISTPRTSSQFAADVDKATNGSLKIKVHSAGSLIKHPEIKRAVRQGTAPIGEVLISLAANEAPVYGVDSVPFLATGYRRARRSSTPRRSPSSRSSSPPKVSCCCIRCRGRRRASTRRRKSNRSTISRV